MAIPENPYASPLADISAEAVAPAGVEEVRRKHLKHEASVRSIGTLYYISGTFLGIGVVGMIAGMIADPAAPSFMLAVLMIYLAMAVLSFVLGAGLRRLDARVKIPVIILSILGLLWIPIGTLINVYILYLLLSAKGGMVFSPYYRGIVAQTPHIKYRTSLLTRILLILLLLMILGGVVAMVLMPILTQDVL